MNIFSLNVVDVVIVLLILCAGVIGMKRGFFKELVMTVGFLLVFIISFLLKSPLAEWLSLNLPFFTFSGSFRGMTVLNIIIYQLIAFLIIFSLVIIVFNLVLTFTNVLEKVLKATIIFGLASKILGFILGIISGLIYMFIICLILSYPEFNQGVIAESKLKPLILKGTPGLNAVASSLVSTFEDLGELSEEYRTNEDKTELNRKSIQVMIDNKLIKIDYVQKLINSGKLKVSGLQGIEY